MSIEIEPPWKIYFDGAAHFGRAGASVVFITSQEEILPLSFTLKQYCTNSVRALQALILGLALDIDMKQLHLQVFGDSHLVINKHWGSYEVKKPELRPYHDYGQKFRGWLRDVTLQHVCRIENKKIDVLVSLVSTLTLSNQTQATICQKWIVPPPNEEEYIENDRDHLVSISEDEKDDWRQPIIDYMCYGILPENPSRRIKLFVMHLPSISRRTHYTEDHLRVYY